MATQTRQTGDSRSESSKMTGASYNASLEVTQQQHTQQLVHREAADAAIKNMTLDTHLNIIPETGSSMNKKQHAIGCEYVHIMVEGRQLIAW